MFRTPYACALIAGVLAGCHVSPTVKDAAPRLTLPAAIAPAPQRAPSPSRAAPAPVDAEPTSNFAEPTAMPVVYLDSPTVTAVPPALAAPTVVTAPTAPAASVAKSTDDSTVALASFSLADFVAEVERVNPNLQAMVAAWRAAAQRYPQVVSLDDPMFMAMVAPASFDSEDVDAAYVVEGAQKLPWFGKRAARGRAAQAEARAAGQEVADARRALVATAELAYLDYYLVARQLELNQENVAVMRQFRSTAESRYRTNQVTQSDVLQAEVDLADLERRRLELRRMETVAIARINTLVRLPLATPLPAAPARLAPPTGELDGDLLQALALEQRPDIAAIAARIRAAQAEVTLASKSYYPDAEVFGRYDSFWQPAATQEDVRAQVGARVNVPLYRQRLDAAVREACWRVSQLQAEYQQKRLDVEYEVAAAYAEVEESRQTLAVYAEQLAPAARSNVATQRSNYETGTSSFLELAAAQRQFIDIREREQETLVDYHRRLSELTRAVGGTLPYAAAPHALASPPDPAPAP